MEATMLESAISKIQQMTLEGRKKIMRKIHDLEYQFSNGYYVPLGPPMPETLPTKTLNGLLSWFESPEGPMVDTPEATNQICLPNSGGYFIQVEDHETVKLYLRKNEYEERQEIMLAKFDEVSFPYGQYMLPEDFIIRVQTTFRESEEKKKVIGLSSKITGSHVKTDEDDGIAQVVTVIDTAGRKDYQKTDPIVNLAPSRTFAESEQPVSPFLYRVKKFDELSKVALFEDDSGAWKVQAVKNVVEYLRNHSIVKTRQIKVVG